MAVDSMELYWPDLNIWSRAAAPPGPISARDGKINDDAELFSDRQAGTGVYLYDVHYDRWIVAGQRVAPVLVGVQPAILTDGSVLETGCETGGVPTRAVYRYAVKS